MKQILPTTFTEYKYLSSPLLSPDGSHTGFVLQTVDMDENCYRADLHQVNNATGDVRKITAQGDAKGFSWLPDGRMVFPAPRGKEWEAAKAECRPLTSYYVIDPNGGEAELLCSLPVSAGPPSILEDGRWIVVGMVDLARPDFDALDGKARKRAVEDYKRPRYHVIDELPYWGNGMGYTSKRRLTMFLCDPKTGQAEAISPRLFNVQFSDVNFGKALYVGSEFDALAQHRKGMCVHDVKSGESRRLIQEGIYDIIQALLLDENTVIARMLEKTHSHYSDGSFYRIDIPTGEITRIAEYDNKSEFCCIVGDICLGMGQPAKVYDGKLYFVTVEGEDGFIRSIDRDGNISERMTGPGVSSYLDVNAGGIVLQGFRGNLLNELYKLDADGTERRLTHFNDFVQDTYAVSERHPVRYTGSDGWEIHGWVIPPVGYEKGKKYPGVLNIHGGPKGTYGSEFNHEMQMWSNAGYFVFFCNPRGSAGRGEAFADINLEMGGVDYVNFMEFTDECLRLWPDIDEKRIGVAGGSYGGYMTNLIVGKTHRFAAAVAQRGISSWVTMEGMSDMGYFANKDQFGCWVEDDVEKLWRISPLKYAHNAKTPTLIVHSDEDYRCPSTEAYQMFSVLRRYGVDCRMVLFHGENHGLSRDGRPQNRLTRMEEILAWLDKYLKV